MLTNKVTPFTSAISIIDSLDLFLTNVKLCVIQTGNQKDAYTLFEVLNDRSFALDDLDLIKNQFYRSFCEKNSNSMADEDIDLEINRREEQWGLIFGSNTGSNQKLISYFTTSYLTGVATIGFKSHDEHREKIKSYLENLEKYDNNDLKTDFNIFQTVKIFVEKFKIKSNLRDAQALEAEFSTNTITYKTVHLLLALGYEGVLAGLMNRILQEIKKDNNFSLEKAEEIIETLITDGSKYKEIHKQSKHLWQQALMGADYLNAKTVANDIIEAVNKGTDSLKTFEGNLDSCDFLEWIQPWRYGGSNLKVRILFARLIRLSYENSKLENKLFSHSLPPKESRKLHLDHMEPTKPGSEFSSNLYYKYGEADRDDDVNALGNMFPLHGTLNISKSNKPMNTIFEELNKSGLGSHWLTIETKNLFDKHHDSTTKAPKQKFFLKRKEFLIKMFEKAIRF